MRAIKEKIFTFSLPFPLLLINSLDVHRTKKETVMNADLQEVTYGYKHSRMDKMSIEVKSPQWKMPITEKEF